jgi:hypothetical protein
VKYLLPPNRISYNDVFYCDVRTVNDVLKDFVYRRKVRDLADMRQRVIEAVKLITHHMLINTWKELEYRLNIRRATTGAHNEVYGRAKISF